MIHEHEHEHEVESQESTPPDKDAKQWAGFDGRQGLEHNTKWLEQEMVRGIIENSRNVAEMQRVERWHATYNAALTGLIVAAGERGMCPETGENFAARHADFAHGKLSGVEEA